MTLEDEYLKTTQSKLRQEVQSQVPKSWRAGSQRNADGTETVTTEVYSADEQVTEDSLLREHGYDPEKYFIIPPWDTNTWTAYKPKEYRSNTGGEDDESAYTFRGISYRLKVAPRPEGQDRSVVEELTEEILSWDMTPGEKPRGSADAFYMAWGDLQIGKVENPLPVLLELTHKVLRDALDEYMSIPVAVRPGHVHVPWLGDCIEGFVSQGGKNAWRTTMTLTEQTRVLRRIMLKTVRTFAPHCKRLTLVSVPGNHDEAAVARELATRIDDSWAVESLVSVEEAIKFSERQDLSHVECYVPGPDEQGVALEVGGAIVSHVHGHQWRPHKAFEWWQGQRFGGQDIGRASILMHGHHHHWEIEEQGQHFRMGLPAMEAESTWWIHRTGTPGNPGAVVGTIRDGKVSTMRRIYG